MKIHNWKSFNEDKSFTDWLKNPSQEGQYSFSLTARVEEVINTNQDWKKLFTFLSEEGWYNFDSQNILKSFVTDLIDNNKYEDIFRYYEDLAEGDDLLNYFKKAGINFDNIFTLLNKAFDKDIENEVEFVDCLKQHFILQDVDIDSYQKQFTGTENEFISNSLEYIFKHDDELFSEIVYQYFKKTYKNSVEAYFQQNPMCVDLVDSDDFYDILEMFNVKAMTYAKNFKGDFKILEFKMLEKPYEGRNIRLNLKTDRQLSTVEQEILGQYVEKTLHTFSNGLEKDEEKTVKGNNDEKIQIYSTVKFTPRYNNHNRGFFYEFKQILK